MNYDRAGYGEGTFKRLFIMASEDIGFGCLNFPEVLHEAHTTWRNSLPDKKTSNSPLHERARTLLINTAVGMSILPKSRLVNQIGVLATKVFYEGEDTSELIQFSPQTKLSSQLGDDRSQLLLQLLHDQIRHKRVFAGAVCLNRIYMANYNPKKAKKTKRQETEAPFENRCALNEMVLMAAFDLFEKLAPRELTKSVIALKFFYSKNPNRLFAMHAMLLAMMPLPELNIHEIPPNLSLKSLTSHVPAELVTRLYMDDQTLMPIPDYAHDKHTKKGKQALKLKNESIMQHFRNVGAYYAHKAEWIHDEFTDAAWNWYFQLEAENVAAGRDSKVKGDTLLKRVMAQHEPLQYDTVLLTKFHCPNVKRLSDSDDCNETPGKRHRIEID
eukprot:TRINITY_DN1438_c0_g1_i1.p1 TRINITY_DN1438_c0_g1~~TRINITY_DN1438_c0_g1_i1.p1  ORF type:complete len:385 (+),score=50.24 TRINITY_DN1438_c0_g1_i1:160-1314(+)